MPTALVTGCSRETGFGQLTAKALAASGFTVFATLRNIERATSLTRWAQERHLDIRLLEQDVTMPQHNRRVVDTVEAATGAIDVLVNNVGMSSFGALETLHEAHIRKTMETNFFSAVDLTRAVLPGMRSKRSGQIVFVTSVAGVTGVPGESIYCASKFALEGLAEALAMETARFGIRINTIRPSFFDTGMSRDNSDVSSFFRQGTEYDDFNCDVIESTTNGESDGEDPQLVADAIVEAVTTASAKLRWQPGLAAPTIIAARAGMSDEAWRVYVMEQLGLSDWLQPESLEVTHA